MSQNLTRTLEAKVCPDELDINGYSSFMQQEVGLGEDVAETGTAN